MKSLSELKFRGVLIEDASWMTEFLNDAEAVKYWDVFPLTEHEVKEWIKKRLEEARVSSWKTIVAEFNGEAMGWVNVDPETGRCRHVAELGIFVGRKHWAKGVGSALMEEAVKLAKQLGLRRLVLCTTDGNERAIRLYKKFGFEIEAYKSEYSYVDDLWRKEYFMGLELAPCEPKISQSMLLSSREPSGFIESKKPRIDVKQLIDRDLDEINRLQNCPESTKSSNRVPPITKEETKRWYEQLKSREGRHCLACFEGSELLGYLQFRAGLLPSPSLNCDEIIVDVNRMPLEAADALVSAVKSFRNRYGYRGIFTFIPQTSTSIVRAFEKQGFKNKGALNNQYFIDGYHSNAVLYGYP